MTSHIPKCRRSNATIRWLACLFITLISGTLAAQNLVPNGSFELYNNCPPGSGVTLISYSNTYTSFPFVQNWVTPIKEHRAAYFNVCGRAPGAVPTNDYGYQRPHSGNAYAGLELFMHPWFTITDTTQQHRGVISTKLTTALRKDTLYFLRFFVSPTIPNEGTVTPIDYSEIGGHFSTSLPDQPSGFEIRLPYHVMNDTTRFLTDTTAWYEISGFYKAKGNEQWLSIGSFLRNLLPASKVAFALPGTYRSHCYIDDVLVMPASKIIHTITACEFSGGSTFILKSSNTSGTYAWNTGDSTRQINITRSGTYYCVAIDNGKLLIDSFYVIPAKKSAFHSMKACDSANKPTTLPSSLDTAVYNWSTGSNTRAITVTAPGLHICIAENACTIMTDSFLVTSDTYDTTYTICDLFKSGKVLTSLFTSPYYKWNTGATTRSIQIPVTGQYECTSFDGCRTVIETFLVNTKKPDAPEVKDTSICQFVISPVLSVKGSGLFWFTSAASTVGTAIQPAINTSKPGKTTLFVVSKDGECISNKIPVTITITSTPAMQPTDTLIRCDGIISFTEYIGSPAPDIVQYAWSTGETDCCILPMHDGAFIRVSRNNCGEAVDTFLIRSEPCAHCLSFPSAFTPNDDGRNDGFGAIVMCPVVRFTMSVYNRWGERIYESEDKDEQWDGRQKGLPAPGGVYMYMATMFNAKTGRKIFAEGEVTLIR